MKTMNEKQIQSLLDKFMEGETTLQEEQVLGEYFRTTKNVKAEWNAYKSMFDYFDKGMPYKEKKQEATHSGKIVKMIVGAISAAAIVALLFTFAFTKNDGDQQLVANNEPKKEVPAKNNNKVEKKQDTSKEETVDTKTDKKSEVPAKKSKKKRMPRLQFNIPAPQNYMAEEEKHDTLDFVDKELINSYLYQCASMDVAMDEIYTQEIYDEQEYITNEE